ncbi:MAG: hypothetical protein RLZZ453_284 [Chlamydiota bacterium]|jgi:hypothetical protein
MWGLYSFCEYKTDGFTLSQITPFPTSCTIACPQPAVLSQPFYYKTQGEQAFVFVSQDNQYVLKIAKNRHYFLYDNLSRLTLPAFIKKMVLKKKEKASQRIQRNLNGYILGFTEAADLTGIVYINLKTPSTDAVTLVDKIGIRHKVCLKDVAFIVQKKGTSLSKMLSKADAEIALRSFFQTIHEAKQRGIQDTDPGFHRNFGFCGNSPFFMDVGGLEKRESVDYTKMMGRLFSFIKDQNPELLPIFDEEIRSL